MPGTVTIAWKITTDVAGAIPATGKVRWHLPRVVLTDEVIAGLAPTPWVDLVAGAGSITIVDPWDTAIAPQGWAPEVEIESNALNARYGVVIPAGSAGQTLNLHKLTTISQAAPGDIYALASHTHEGGGGGDDVPPARQILAGTGLAGGGTLAADRTIALNAASIASLAKADTAVQPAGLATVATSGAYADLTGQPAIPDSPDDIGAAPTTHTHTVADVTGLQTALDDLAGRIKAFATSDRQTVQFGPAGTLGTWTLCPAAYRVTIPAAVGDLLHWAPRVIAGVSGGDAELDVASVVSGSPARYYSSGTTSQSPNGHGGLYLGGNYNNGLNAINWVVTADDIDDGTVTLALMYRSAGTGVLIGSTLYPGQVDVTNHGTAA